MYSPKGITRNVTTEKARFCDEICAEAFQEDRNNTLNYPNVNWKNKLISWEKWSLELCFCAYCNQNLTSYPQCKLEK